MKKMMNIFGYFLDFFSAIWLLQAQNIIITWRFGTEQIYCKHLSTAMKIKKTISIRKQPL